MIEIKEYDEKYADKISEIVIRNLLEVNVRDYGEEFSKEHAEEFTTEKIKEAFKSREKVYVALLDDNVVGTAGIAKSWYNDDGEFWILTVFIKPENHRQGIGRVLMEQIEKYAREIKAKKLVIPASITGCEFYHKLGYEYSNGKKELNEENMYIMEKFIKYHVCEEPDNKEKDIER